MKAIVTIVRILVGLLFIFSGLVKANDPLGLSYKMQEFFEIWGMEQFHSWTLAASILMNAFEIIAGFALLLGWQIRVFIWLLLLLIVFFTFLTGYTYITGKPANCGCFGDCIPITSKTSFLKDVLLTLLIGFLFFQRSRIKPLLPGKAGAGAMLLVTIFSFGLQWYSLKYLPLVDCLPYKKGNNIPAKMQIPPGAIPDSFAIMFVYARDGKEYEFSPSDLPADLAEYKFVKRTDKLVRKGNAEPPIKGFTLSGITDEDSTHIVLTHPYALLIFCEEFSRPVTDWKSSLQKIYSAAKEKNIPLYAVTTQLNEAKQQFVSAGFPDIPVFKCDYTAIRTAARASPTIYLLQHGTIVDKKSTRETEAIVERLASVPVQELPVINEPSTADSTDQ